MAAFFAVWVGNIRVPTKRLGMYLLKIDKYLLAGSRRSGLGLSKLY
jgi:hypothetical protein